MRRWLTLVAGVAAIAATGTALALTGADRAAEEEAATEKTVEVEVTTTTVDDVAEQETIPTGEVEAEELSEESPKAPVAPRDPIDHTPPPVAILHPEDGQVFEQKEVVFEGTTEPDARVYAGEYEAEVAGDGSWRIVLGLSPGENVVTVKAKDSSGNYATASVTVVYRAPEKVEAEEPKEEEPKEEEPKEDEATWEFSAHQLYGECGEDPPYDVFYGSGKPGTSILVKSEFGSGSTEIGESGEWEIKVFFESAPVGEAFPVKVADEFGNYQVFEFIRTG